MDTNGNSRGCSQITWWPSPLWWTRSSTLIALTILVAAGCGGGSSEDDAGGGLDAPGLDARRDPDDAGRYGDDADGSPGCTIDADCDDGVDCTEDRCSTAAGSCRHVITPALCAAGASCHPERGCEIGRACADTEDCEDDDPCTINERCNPSSSTCVVDPLDRDGDGDLPLVCGGTDCNDDNGAIHGGALELCDRTDNDCDSDVDEGLRGPLCELCYSVYVGTCGGGIRPPECYELLRSETSRLRCANEEAVLGQIEACVVSSCEAYELCAQAAWRMCTCPADMTYCSSGCVDTDSTREHCGGCDNHCGPGRDCVGGTCGRCGVPGQPCCAGDDCERRPYGRNECVAGLCEGCGYAGEECCTPGGGEDGCYGEPTCNGARCGCTDGEAACQDSSGDVSCVDLQTDLQNCGSCRRLCSGNCIGGECCGTRGGPCCPGDRCYDSLYCRGAVCSSA